MSNNVIAANNVTAAKDTTTIKNVTAAKDSIAPAVFSKSPIRTEQATQEDKSLQERQKASLTKKENIMPEDNTGYDFDLNGLSFGDKKSSKCDGKTPNMLIKANIQQTKKQRKQWVFLTDKYSIWKRLHQLHPTANLNRLSILNIMGGGDCWFATISTLTNGHVQEPRTTPKSIRQMTAEMVTVNNVDAFLTASTSTPKFPAKQLLKITNINDKVELVQKLIRTNGDTYLGEQVTWTHLLSQHQFFQAEKIGLVIVHAEYLNFAAKRSHLSKPDPTVFVEVLKNNSTQTLFYMLNTGEMSLSDASHYQLLAYTDSVTIDTSPSSVIEYQYRFTSPIDGIFECFRSFLHLNNK